METRFLFAVREVAHALSQENDEGARKNVRSCSAGTGLNHLLSNRLDQRILLESSIAAVSRFRFLKFTRSARGLFSLPVQFAVPCARRRREGKGDPSLVTMGSFRPACYGLHPISAIRNEEGRLIKLLLRFDAELQSGSTIFGALSLEILRWSSCDQSAAQQCGFLRIWKFGRVCVCVCARALSPSLFHFASRLSDPIFPAPRASNHDNS